MTCWPQSFIGCIHNGIRRQISVRACSFTRNTEKWYTGQYLVYCIVLLLVLARVDLNKPWAMMLAFTTEICTPPHCPSRRTLISAELQGWYPHPLSTVHSQFKNAVETGSLRQRWGSKKKIRNHVWCKHLVKQPPKSRSDQESRKL